jgi:hypothetical protein
MTNDYQVVVQRLSTITSAAHTVRFVAQLRTDALSPTSTQQEYRLDSMVVSTPGSVVLRRFRFDHDYSTGRLTLKNIYEQDRNNLALPPHSFVYNGGSFPAYSSFALDHWGYFNGKTSNTTSIPGAVTPSGAVLSGGDRRPDSVSMKTGVLSRITYPTGGYHEFVFEANDYSALAQHLEPRKPDVVRRHRTFLAALESTGVTVNLAKFKRKERVVTLAESRVQFQPIRRWWHLPLRSVRVSFETHEEKETDVAIACKLLEVLHRGQCDAVVLLTGDTDIAPAIRTARALYPKQEIIVAFPFQRYNKELANLVARSVKLSVQLYEAHQFPVTVMSAKGKPIVKPKTW